MKGPNMEKKLAYIYGKNAVAEAIENDTVAKIFIVHGNQSASSIFNKAKKEKIPCVTYDKRKFNEFERTVLPIGIKSQGIIALRNLSRTYALEELIGMSKKVKNPVIVILDEIADPQNLGAIARSAECSGAVGIVMPERNSSPITPVAVKASAGALEYMPVAKVSNLGQAIIKLKDSGFWIVGTDMKGSKKHTDKIYDSPIGVVIGSEGKGIRPAILKQCDHLVKIPMLGKITSLNASVSAGIILYEILRQKLDN